MTLRILHIAATLERGAAPRHMAHVATGLPREKFDVYVCALGGGPLLDQLERSRVPVAAFGNGRVFDPPAWWRLRQHILRIQPDIVHTWPVAGNTIGRWTTLAAGVARLAATIESIEESSSPIDWASERYLDSRTGQIVAESESVAQHLASRVPAGKVRVIPPGICPSTSSDRSREQVLAELGLPDGVRLIAAASRLEWSERMKDLIWAADLLKVIRGDVHLVVMGDGSQREGLLRYRRLCRIDDKVHFLGDRADLAQLLPHFHVFWSAGTTAGLSPGIMEAMAAGVPVVAADTPSNRELVVDQETGYLVPVGDRAGFGRCANKLIDDRELARRLGNAARERIASHFTIQAMIDAHATLYRDMMKEL